MAERKAAVKAAAEPDFLQFNDLACEGVGGKVSHSQVFIPSLSHASRNALRYNH